MRCSCTKKVSAIAPHEDYILKRREQGYPGAYQNVVRITRYLKEQERVTGSGPEGGLGEWYVEVQAGPKNEVRRGPAPYQPGSDPCPASVRRVAPGPRKRERGGVETNSAPPSLVERFSLAL